MEFELVTDPKPMKTIFEPTRNPTRTNWKKAPQILGHIWEKRKR